MTSPELIRLEEELEAFVCDKPYICHACPCKEACEDILTRLYLEKIRLAEAELLHCQTYLAELPGRYHA